MTILRLPRWLGQEGLEPENK